MASTSKHNGLLLATLLGLFGFGFGVIYHLASKVDELETKLLRHEHYGIFEAHPTASTSDLDTEQAAIITALVAKMDAQGAQLDELSSNIESLAHATTLLMRERRLHASEQDDEAADTFTPPSSSIKSGGEHDSLRMLFEQPANITNLILYQLFIALKEIAANVEALYKCVGYDSANGVCVIGSEDVTVSITAGGESFVIDNTTAEALQNVKDVVECISYDESTKACSVGGESIESIDVLAKDVVIATNDDGSVYMGTNVNGNINSGKGFQITEANGAKLKIPGADAKIEAENVVVTGTATDSVAKMVAAKVVVAGTDSSYMGQNTNGNINSGKGFQITEANGAQLKSPGADAKIVAKNVVVAGTDSSYMGTNVNGNINSAADNGLKVDGTAGDAKIVAKNVVVAGTDSSYMGTNVNGNINSAADNGLKVDGTAGAQLKSLGADAKIVAKNVVVAGTDSSYMGQNTNGNINSGKGFQITEANGAQLKSPGADAKIVAKNVVVAGTDSSYMGTNVNGNINSAADNGLKIDGTAGAQLKSPGADAKIVAKNVIVAGTDSSYMGQNTNGNINSAADNGLKVDASAIESSVAITQS